MSREDETAVRDQGVLSFAHDPRDELPETPGRFRGVGQPHVAMCRGGVGSFSISQKPGDKVALLVECLSRGSAVRTLEDLTECVVFS